MSDAKKNRIEIQYLRAVAIVAVLGFHLTPTYVQQGYLGVDIFFVLSGYLMTMLLGYSSTKKPSRAVVVNFYERRLKRLSPVYLNAILLTLIFGSFILTTVDFKFLQRDALLAVVFGTNFEGLITQQSYFELVATQKFLLHTWSLSVEVQYYLIAPVVLAGIAVSRSPMLMAFVIAFCSWGFQTVYMTNDTLAFYSLPARLWQFLLGTIAYYAEKKQSAMIQAKLNEILTLKEQRVTKENETQTQKRRVMTGCFLVLLCFMPAVSELLAYKTMIRTLATLFTAYIVFLGPPKIEASFTNRVILYFGDISYSVYLIHWPMEIFTRYQYPEAGNRHILLLIIIVVSILQYEIFEKNLLRATGKVVFIVCGVLYLIIIPQCFIENGLRPIPLFNTNDAIALNEQYANCITPGFCDYDPEITNYFPKSKASDVYACTHTGNGTLTVFVAGNSFALRQINVIRKVFNGRFKKLYYMARPSCVVFEHMNIGLPAVYRCEEMSNRTHVFMKEIRPDIMIIVQGGFIGEISAKASSSEAVKNETIVQKMQHFIQLYSGFTRKLLLVEPHGRLWHNPAQKMAQLLKTGQSLEGYHQSTTDYYDFLKYTWWRHEAALEGCKNCMVVNQTSVFCHAETQTCDIFDKDSKVSLYCDASHLSIEGLKRIEPLYKIAIDKVIKELNG